MKSRISVWKLRSAVLDASRTVADREKSSLKPSELWLRLTVALISATGVGVVIWLSAAKTEEIIAVSGELEPIGTAVEVSGPLPGVISKILVEEGQNVRKGQPVLELDSNSDRSKLAAIKSIVASKENQLTITVEEYQSRRGQVESDLETLEKRVGLESDIAKRLKDLEKSGASSKLQLLQQNAKVEETKGQLDRTRIELRILDSTKRKAINALKQEVTDLRSSLVAENEKVMRKTIVAPVDGLVFNLQPKEKGFVVGAGSPLLSIVPQKKLEALVKIPSQYIGLVNVGQKAEVAVDSYPANDFGTIKGKIISISSDALDAQPLERAQTPTFPTRIGLSEQGLKIRRGKTLPLQAGMSVIANIKLREVSYMQLLLSGLSDKTESVRRRN